MADATDLPVAAASAPAPMDESTDAGVTESTTPAAAAATASDPSAAAPAASGDADAPTSSAAADGGGGDESAPRERKKKSKKDKSKKGEKVKKRRSKYAPEGGEPEEAATATTEGGEGGDEEGGDDEDESGSGSSSASSSSSEDPDAELTDADEEARRARKRARKEKREKKAARKAKSKGKSSKSKGHSSRSGAKAAMKFFDVEAEVSSDEEVSGDEDDDADERGDIADLIAPEEEVQREIGAEKRGKRKRRVIREEDLDEEDINLVKEAHGIETRESIDKDVERSSDEDDDAKAAGGARKRLKKGAARDDVLDLERLSQMQRERERKLREQKARGRAEEDDYDDGFIAPEDDEDDAAMMAQPARGKAKQRRREDMDDNMADFVEDDAKVSTSNEGGGEMSSGNRERLRELFGSVSQFFQGKRAASKSRADDSDGAYGEEDGAEDEAIESDESDVEYRRELERKKRERAPKPSGISERAARMHAMRVSDIPERMYQRHLRRQANLAGLNEEETLLERQQEASWIFHQLFLDPHSQFYSPPSHAQSAYGAYPPPAAAQAKDPQMLVPTLLSVLGELQDEHLEITFIATYHRDMWGSRMMSAQATLTEEQLLKVDELDERWIELGARRRKLAAMLDNYAATASLSNLHLDESNRGADAYLHYATPPSSTLAEWKKLLSAPDATGLTELDDVQDALKVVTIVDACKRKQAAHEKRAHREYAAKMRRGAREERRLFKLEQKQRAADERARLRAEQGEAFDEAAAAAAEAEEQKDDSPAEVSDPEDAAMDEDDADLLAVVRSRSIRGQFGVLTKCWSIVGVPALAAAMTITPSQFAENATLNFASHLPRDGVWNAEDLAKTAVDQGHVRDIDEALLVARRYAAFLLASNPLLRREVRKHYLDHGEVWTFPTSKGVRDMDESHEYAPVRRIVAKPIARMSEHPAQFLLMHQAEKDGFIRVEFRLPASKDPVNRMRSMAMEQPEADDLTATLCELYLTNDASPDGLKWNTQRRLILHDALATYLVPLCHAHVRTTLLRHSMDFVSRRVANKLSDMLCVQGFKPEGVEVAEDSSDDEGAAASGKRRKKKGAAASQAANWRIFSLIVGDQYTPTYLAVLNRYGQLMDHLCLHHLKSNASARGRNGEALGESERLQYARKKDDVRKLMELVQTHQPRLMLLDASSMEARHFKDDLRMKILLDRQDIRVEFHDPEVSRVYMNSARAELEFREYPRNLRQAISMGRQALDPIAELAGLFSGPMDATQWEGSANTSAQLMNSIRAGGKSEDEALKKDVVAAATNALSNDMLALAFHPLQRALPTGMLLATLRRTLTRVVNYVGVDINKLHQRPWLSGTLQFLTGLGPIKAKMMLDYVKKRGFLASREELLSKDAIAHAIKAEDGVKLEPGAAAPAAAAAQSRDMLFGPCVYRNCCGFVLIRANAALDQSGLAPKGPPPLDETRIHPDSYAEVGILADNAFDVDEAEEAALIEKNVARALKKRDGSDEEDEEDDDEHVIDDDEEDEDGNRSSAAAQRKAAKLAAREARIRARTIHQMRVARIKDLMKPEGLAKFDELDLDQYVEMSVRDAQTRGEQRLPNIEAVQMIRTELRDPFGDFKHILRAFSGPTPGRLFTLLTGETSRTLREGLLIPVVVSGVQPAGKGAYVKLDSGLKGFLSLRNVSDSAPQGSKPDMMADPRELEREVNDNLAWLRARLAPGLSINARILRVEKDKFMVEVSTKSSDLNQSSWDQGAAARAEREAMLAQKYGRSNPANEVDEIEQDLYFPEQYAYPGTVHPDDAELLRKEAGPQKKVARFRQRNITHTLFRNFSREEAVAYLRDKAVGDVVVRPSSLGTNHLTLTWKVSNEEVASADGADAPPEKGIYFHVDLLEHNKANELEVGSKLTVKRENGKEHSFEDLDEVAARFVHPMLRWVHQLTGHKNFRYGGDAEIQQILYAEKQQDRAKIPYVLHFATTKERAGAFQFSFLPNTTVKSSSIVVVPEGYLYHQNVYKSLALLLAAVKAEMSTRVGVAPPAGSQRAAAKQSSSRQAVDRKPVSLPPYAAAAPTAPLASNRAPPAAALPPYAAAAPAPAAVPAPSPYAQPPQQPQFYPQQPPVMPPYAGASAGPQYGVQPPQQPYGGAQPYGASQQQSQGYGVQPQQSPYGVQPPQAPYGAQPSYGQSPYAQAPYGQQMPMPPPQQQSRFQPAPQQPAAVAPPAAAGGALPTSGYVHPSRLGIVAHAPAPQQAPPQQAYGAYPQQQQQQQAPGGARASRWATAAPNTRDEDMQM